MAARSFALVALVVLALANAASAQYLPPTLQHHDILVGGGLAGAARDNPADARISLSTAYWNVDFNRLFAPLYATRGDRLVFVINRNRNTFTVPRGADAGKACGDSPSTNYCHDIRVVDADAYTSCHLASGRGIGGEKVGPLTTNPTPWQRGTTTGETTLMQSKFTYELKQSGAQYFVDAFQFRAGPRLTDSCFNVNLRGGGLMLKVDVDTGVTSRFLPSNLGAARGYKHHEWRIGGAAGWNQLTSANDIGYAPIWASRSTNMNTQFAYADYAVFDYGGNSDVYRFNGKYWFDQCNFFGSGSTLATNNHGCNAANAAPFNCRESNSFRLRLDDPNTYYISSSTSAFQKSNVFEGSTSNPFLFSQFFGSSSQNLIGLQNYACTVGKQKLEIHTYDDVTNVETCNSVVNFWSQYFGGSDLMPWLFGSNDCYDFYSYNTLYTGTTHGAYGPDNKAPLAANAGL